MPTAWGCFPAERSPKPANGTWRSSPLWAQSARTSGPSAIFVSCIWTPSAMCLCRCCGSRVTQAHQQDAADDAALGSRRGDELPAELARREDRLATIEAAMRRLEARAKADAEAERQRRTEVEAERQRLGSPRRGKAPKPVDETPDDKAQTNFTDPELQIMRTNNKGWEYCGNAQAS